MPSASNHPSPASIARTRRGRHAGSKARYPHQNLGVEQLEVRQLMAADAARHDDLLATVPALLGGSRPAAAAPAVVLGATSAKAAAVPAAPRLSAATVSNSSIRLTWNNVAKETGYCVYQRVGNADTWTQVAVIAANTTKFTVTQLDPGTTYTFRVDAFNASGARESNLASATTKGVAILIGPKLTATAISSEAVSLSWNDVANEKGYRVFQTSSIAYNSWACVATLGAGSTGYTSTNLAHGNNYWFKVVAFNDTVTAEGLDSVAAARTYLPMPSAPTLSATAASPSSITLTWNDVADEDYYQVYQWSSGAGIWLPWLPSVGANGTSFTATGLASGSTYFFKVAACNMTGTAESGYISATTQVAPPVAPTLYASAISSSSINLTWNDVANENGYRVYQWNGYGWGQLTTVDANTTMCTVSGLSASTTYSFKVAAFNDGGSADSMLASATTRIAPPVAPTLFASAISSSSINLTWNDVANENGYCIYQRNGYGWVQLTTVGTNTTTCTVSGLFAGTTYSFKVAAFNDGGSAESLQASAMTQVAPPVAPRLSAAAASSSSINLTWNDVANENGYRVYQWTNVTWTLISTMGANTTTYTASGLSSGIRYSFKVVAFNDAGIAESTAADAAPYIDNVTHPWARATYAPASGTLFGSDGRATYWDVKQGNLGDCWLMAGLASIAARQPGVIENMFVNRGQSVQFGYTVDVYDVRIYDTAHRVHWVTVDTLLPAGGSYYAQTRGDCLWVGLAERAYAQAADQGWVQTNSSNGQLSGYAKLDAGFGSWAISAFTGGTGHVDQLWSFSGQAAMAWNNGVPYTLGTGQQTDPRLFTTHAYALVGYDPRSAYPYKIFNPHNTPDGAKFGSLFEATGLDSSLFALSAYACNDGSAESGMGVDAAMLAVATADMWSIKTVAVVAVDPRVTVPVPEFTMKAATMAPEVTANQASPRAAAFAALAAQPAVDQEGGTDGPGLQIKIAAWRNFHLESSLRA